jgi:phospholipase/carboxylesterase
MDPLTGPSVPPRAGGAARQLVVLLHGVGADGHDLIDLAAQWAPALPHAAFVSPDGPEPYDMIPPGMAHHGRQWFSLADRTPSVLEAGIARARPAVDAFLDAELARLGLPPDAYALMGFSQGAMTALYVGLRRAVPPRAILAYSGSLLAPDAVAALPAQPPVLLVHGEADEVVPVARSRAAEATLRAAGLTVDALYVPRLGHGIDPSGLSAGGLFLQRAFAAAS